MLGAEAKGEAGYNRGRRVLGYFHPGDNPPPELMEGCSDSTMK